MTRSYSRIALRLTLLLLFALSVKSAAAQGVTILEGEDLKKVLPTSFYFEGLSGAYPVQKCCRGSAWGQAARHYWHDRYRRIFHRCQSQI